MDKSSVIRQLLDLINSSIDLTKNNSDILTSSSDTSFKIWVDNTKETLKLILDDPLYSNYYACLIKKIDDSQASSTDRSSRMQIIMRHILEIAKQINIEI